MFTIHFFVSGEHFLLGAYMSCYISINRPLLKIFCLVDFENNNKHVYLWNFIGEVINPINIDFNNHFSFGLLSWVLFLHTLSRCLVLLHKKYLPFNLAIFFPFTVSFFLLIFNVEVHHKLALGAITIYFTLFFDNLLFFSTHSLKMMYSTLVSLFFYLR